MVEEGSVTSAVELLYRERRSGLSLRLPNGYMPPTKLFDLSTEDQDGRPVSVRFKKPVMISVKLGRSELAQAGADHSRFTIHHYHEAENGSGTVWSVLPASINVVTREAWAQVDRLSLFALAVREPGATQTAAAATVSPSGPAPEATAATPTAAPAETVVPGPEAAPQVVPSPAPSPTASQPTPPFPVPSPTPVPTPAAARPTAASVTPTAESTPEPSPAPPIQPAGKRLFLNDVQVGPDQIVVPVANGWVTLHQLPGPDGTYPADSTVTFLWNHCSRITR